MKLLISVVSAREVAAAVQGGADIIDVKNPAEGALGAGAPHVIRQVRAATPAALPVSATLGDLPQLPGTAALAALGAATCGIQYVKVGLKGAQDVEEAEALLREVCRAVRDYDDAIRIIACGYADADQIGALAPADLPLAATQAGVDGCLLDTFDKSHGNLFSCLTDAQLHRFVAECRQSGLLCALAGSLKAEDLPRVREYGADIVGVRTAACVGGRVHGRVEANKVRHLKSLLHDTGFL